MHLLFFCGDMELVIEGCDGVGKTRLVDHILKKYNNIFVSLKFPSDSFEGRCLTDSIIHETEKAGSISGFHKLNLSIRDFVYNIDKAKEQFPNNIILCDRSYISGFVYNNIMRRMVHTPKIKYLIFFKPDFETLQNNLLEKRGIEHLSKYDKLFLIESNYNNFNKRYIKILNELKAKRIICKYFIINKLEQSFTIIDGLLKLKNVQNILN